MRIMNVKVLVAVLMLLPVVASATHLASVIPEGDCLGWSADLTIRFRAAVYSADVTLEVMLVDEGGNVLETQNWAGELTREIDSYQTQVYSFSGEWTVYEPAGEYRVVVHATLSSPYPGGIDENSLDGESDFLCDVVPTEDSTWSSVKGIYR